MRIWGRGLAVSCCGVALALLLPRIGSSEGASADLSVKISGPQAGQVGDTLVYALEITNAGPSPAEDVTARLNVPKAFTGLEATVTQGVCNLALNDGYDCTIGQLTPGETITGSLKVRLAVRETTVLSFSASSPTQDPASENNLKPLAFLPPSPPTPPSTGGSGGLFYPVIRQPMPPAMVGRSYSARIPIVGGTPPYRVVLRPMCGKPNPAGLAVSEDGVLSFTPTIAGDMCVAVSLYDQSQPGRDWPSGNARIRVTEALVVRAASDSVTGARYDSSILAGGTPPYRVAVRGVLPDGLNGPDAAGRITGTATVSGPFRFTVSVEDSLGFSIEGTVDGRIRVGRGRSLLLNADLTPGRSSGRPRCRGAAGGTSGEVGVSRAVRLQLLAVYGVWWRPELYEIDHAVPVELGGHPTAVANLWPQRADRAKRTDVLERFLVQKVCAGSLSLQAAQKRIRTHKRNVG